MKLSTKLTDNDFWEVRQALESIGDMADNILWILGPAVDSEDDDVESLPDTTFGPVCEETLDDLLGRSRFATDGIEEIVREIAHRQGEEECEANELNEGIEVL
jgi:hypothetical protein